MKAIKVTFEALGQTHEVYSEKLNCKQIQSTIKQICPTARIKFVWPEEISDTEYQSNHISSIDEWMEEQKSRFAHVGTEALK